MRVNRLSRGATILVVCLLLVILLSGCDSSGTRHASSASTQTPAPSLPSILFVGDSLTVGYYATSQTHTYAALTAADLHAASTVVPTHYGNTTVALLKQVQTDPPASGMAAVVVELGTNDYLRESVAAFQTQYTDLISTLRQDEPNARFACLSVWNPFTSVDAAAPYNVVIQATCAERAQGYYVDLSAIAHNGVTKGPKGQSTWLGKNDAWHPNDVGHKRIAATVEQALGF